MKYKFLPLLVLLAGCQQQTEYVSEPYSVVDETYVHKYGFEVTPDEWQTRGEHGQKITTLKNGVTVKRSYKFGDLDGETTYTYPYSSAIQKSEKYEEGKLKSEINFSLAGTPLNKKEYEGNTVTITVWYAGGQPQAIEEYDGDALIQGTYYSPQGAIESKVVDSVGERINRGPQSELISKDTIAAGHLFERVIPWPNGHPKEIADYHQNVLHGHRRTFEEGGEPVADEMWQNGLQNGITVLYVNGEKFAEVPYRNGLKSGVEKRYKDGKQLFEEVTWLDGTEQGSRNYLEKG